MEGCKCHVSTGRVRRPGAVRGCEYERTVSAQWDQARPGTSGCSRYLEAGEQSLDDLPKAPPPRTERLVVDLRREHPTKGRHVLARMLKDRGGRGGAGGQPSSHPSLGLQGAYPSRGWTVPPNGTGRPSRGRGGHISGMLRHATGRTMALPGQRLLPPLHLAHRLLVQLGVVQAGHTIPRPSASSSASTGPSRGGDRTDPPPPGIRVMSSKDLGSRPQGRGEGIRFRINGGWVEM